MYNNVFNVHACLCVCLCASLEKEAGNCFFLLHPWSIVSSHSKALYTRRAWLTKGLFVLSHDVTFGIASIHIFYLVLNTRGQSLIRLYCINTPEPRRTFLIMSLVLSDKLLADVAWCVGTVCLTESYRHTSACVVRIWPDITVELGCCWCFSECFMTCVSTDQFKET